MNIKSPFILVVYLCVSVLAFSQDNTISKALNKQNISINNTEIKLRDSYAKDIIPFWKGWAVGFNYGFTQFDGDIRQYNHYPSYEIERSTTGTGNFCELKTAFSLLVNKQINPFYSLSAEFLSGSFSGLRRNEAYLGYEIHDPYQNYEGRGDKFSTIFKEVDFIFNIDITNAIAYFLKAKQINKLSLETNLGIGYNIFNSIRRNLISDTYIYGFGYTDEGVNSTGTNYGSQKADFFSSPSQTVYIYGLKAKYKLNARINLLLDYTVRNSETDIWDASIMITQNRKDKFSFLSIGLAYKIGGHDDIKKWKRSIDGLKDDVSTSFVKIDGFTAAADNDGVSDAFDKSPNTPLGVAVDGSGNALDVDVDNVPEYRDADLFSNRFTQVDDNGKELDDDNGRMSNSVDLETNTVVGALVNQFGVNLSNTNYLNSGGLIYLPSIYFNYGSTIVVNSNENRIATIALLLKKNLDIYLNVIGHTDNIGMPKFNKELGLKRANAVICHLVFNYNISQDRLFAITKGEEEQLSNVKGINRRVDFEIVD